MAASRDASKNRSKSPDPSGREARPKKPARKVRTDAPPSDPHAEKPVRDAKARKPPREERLRQKLSVDGSPERWVPLAEVSRPHGIQGELRLKLFNRDSSVLEEADEVLVRLTTGEEYEVSVDRARRADAAILMKLYSVDDRDRAEDLRGALICVKRSQFPQLEEGEFFVCDVLGARVTCPIDGAVVDVGVVHDICSYPSVDTIVIVPPGDGKLFEVPLVEAFVESVDIKTGVVALRTLEGVDRS